VEAREGDGEEVIRPNTNPEPESRNPKSETRITEPETRDPKSDTQNLKPGSTATFPPEEPVVEAREEEEDAALVD
jgi:hypothetical protein